MKFKRFPAPGDIVELISVRYGFVVLFSSLHTNDTIPHTIYNRTSLMEALSAKRLIILPSAGLALNSQYLISRS